MLKINFNIADLRTSTPRVPSFDSRAQAFRSPTQMGLSTDIGLQHFSAKHSGLYLYVGRILRPIWNVRCIKQETISNKNVVSNREKSLLYAIFQQIIRRLSELFCVLLLFLFLEL